MLTRRGVFRVFDPPRLIDLSLSPVLTNPGQVFDGSHAREGWKNFREGSGTSSGDRVRKFGGRWLVAQTGSLSDPKHDTPYCTVLTPYVPEEKNPTCAVKVSAFFPFHPPKVSRKCYFTPLKLVGERREDVRCYRVCLQERDFLPSKRPPHTWSGASWLEEDPGFK